MPDKDPYTILGVSRNATQDEIKRAYRRLAKAHHPDRNPGNRAAEQRFKEVQAAYEVLGDPERRAQFDRFGAGGPTPHYHTWASNGPHVDEEIRFDFGSLGDLSGIFDQFFRRARSRGGGVRTAGVAPRGADIEHTVEIGFEESLRGTSREILLQSPDGVAERIHFHVPAGVRDGQRVRVRGRGQPGPGGRGDVMIRVRVRPHPYLRREGADLVLDLPLSVSEAALGAIVEVPTLDGRALLKVPPGTSGGTRLRLRGAGVPDPRGNGAGDLLAVVRIHVPRELSPRARELFESLAREPAGAPPPRPWEH